MATKKKKKTKKEQPAMATKKKKKKKKEQPAMATKKKKKTKKEQPAITAVKAEADRQLRADQVLQIISDCIYQTTGSTTKVELTNTLQDYRVDTSDQITVFITYVTGSTDYGVPKYSFSLDKNALNGIANSSKISDVATRIQNAAVPG